MQLEPRWNLEQSGERLVDKEVHNPYPNKQSYDKSLSFSRITADNWLDPDRDGYMPLRVTQVEWIAAFLRPSLSSSVPLPVVQLFEIARGCMIYSWFFYPLATLAYEQCMRVGETALRHRRRMLNEESQMFAKDLAALVRADVISSTAERRWQAIRRMRNNRSHAERLMLLDPGQAVGGLECTAELINDLFR